MPTSIWLPPVIVLSRLGPAFGKGQGAGAERTSFTLARPCLANRLCAVHRQPRTERGDKQRAHTVGPSGVGIRLGVDQQRLADIMPCQRDLFVPRADALGPEVARVT